MNKKLACLSLILFLVAGCGARKKIISKDFFQHEEIIAKFADLPDAPFQAQLKNVAVSEQAHDELQLFYTIAMPVDDVVAFYQQQMERLGWQLLAESTTKDYLMHYSKPEQICSILISGNSLSIYVCNKKGA